jgi:hypothetical protein
MDQRHSRNQTFFPTSSTSSQHPPHLLHIDSSVLSKAGRNLKQVTRAARMSTQSPNKADKAVSAQKKQFIDIGQVKKIVSPLVQTMTSTS